MFIVGQVGATKQPKYLLATHCVCSRHFIFDLRILVVDFLGAGVPVLSVFVYIFIRLGGLNSSRAHTKRKRTRERYMLEPDWFVFISFNLFQVVDTTVYAVSRLGAISCHVYVRTTIEFKTRRWAKFWFTANNVQDKKSQQDPDPNHVRIIFYRFRECGGWPPVTTSMLWSKHISQPRVARQPNKLIP